MFLAMTRAMVSVYSCCYLVISLRVQINIIGGYMFMDGIAGLTYNTSQVCWCVGRVFHVVDVDLPLLRVAVEGSDNPITLDQPCQASLPPD